jgi:hypothetical protein
MIGSGVEMGIRVAEVSRWKGKTGGGAHEPTNRLEVARRRDHRPRWRLPAMDPDLAASPDTETALTQSTPDEVLLLLLPRI